MIALLPALALAAGPVEQAQQAELERVRGEVANQIHLAAFDLVDELVHDWTTRPIFDAPTPVVLASVTVPVGLGTGLQALLENHLADVLLHHPSTHVQLVHCPRCTAVLVQSGPEATVVSRGIDNPEVLAELGASTGRHALFVDIEAEGTALVLRARLTRLTPDLPIVWSHTLASVASAPALLRDPTALKSAAEARQEYLDALEGRGLLSVPLRLAVRTYARPARDDRVPPPPFIWLQTGVELAPTHARAWTGSLVAGYSFVPQAYQGLMAQARVNRLLSGRVSSLTRPDLYLYFGGAVMTVWGPATAPFQSEPLNADTLLANADDEGPRTAFGALQVGVELRIGQRIGASLFLENVPDLGDSRNVGEYLTIGSLGFQSVGMEVTFWF